MLSSITKLFKNNSGIFRSGIGQESKNQLSVFENIDRHIFVLQHRNTQLRETIIGGSEEDIRKRHSQFVSVLQSYVYLIVMDLHGSIVKTRHVSDNMEYLDVRNETFAGYEDLLTRANRSVPEIIKLGSEFARELFQIELQIKQYQQLERKVIYPLYKIE